MTRRLRSHSQAGTLTVLWATVLALASVAPRADAAMVEQTLQQLTAQADRIVQGSVLATASQWDASHSYIFTTVALRASEVIKGTIAVDSTVLVVVPGGEVGGVGYGVEHAPHFTRGEAAIVFLTDLGDGRFRVTGWEQGKFTVNNNKVVEKRISVQQFKDQIREALK